MASRVHLGHVFHVAGSPLVTEAADALVSIPDGALVLDDLGRIAYCGERSQIPTDYASSTVRDHRPGYLLPGFVDTHVHFPQTYAADSYGGGQLLEWLNLCVFPSESKFADPEFAQQAAVDFCARGVAAGTTAAIAFGSAFPHAQDALFTETTKANLRLVSGRGIQTVGPASATALLTSEADAIRLTREEIDKWHAADTGDVDTALLHVAVVPRFSLSVTTTTLEALGELYEEVRDRGVYFHSHLNENNRPGDEGEGARRAAHHDVGRGEFLLEGAKVDGIAFDLGGEGLRARQSPVGDHHALDAGRCEVAGGESDHLACADHQRGVRAQVRINALRQAHRGGGEGNGVGPDLRFGAHALGRRKRRLKQLVERRSCAAVLLGEPVRILQLTQNLRFAEHHRVQTRGDAEGVLHRQPLLMDVQTGGQFKLLPWWRSSHREMS